MSRNIRKRMIFFLNSFNPSVFRLKKMNKTHFGFYLIRFSIEKPIFLVAIGPLSGELRWKRTFLGSILVKVFYLYQGLCEYQKRDLSKTIFTLISPKVTLKDPAIGPPSEIFNFFSRVFWNPSSFFWQVKSE